MAHPVHPVGSSNATVFSHDPLRGITMAVYEIIIVLHFSSKSQKPRNSLPT